jgi:hypothetical protein
MVYRRRQFYAPYCDRGFEGIILFTAIEYRHEDIH